MTKEPARLLTLILLSEAELDKIGLLKEWRNLKENDPLPFGNDAPLSPHLGKPQIPKVHHTTTSKQRHTSNRRRF